MSAYTVEEVIQAYLDLRDVKRQMEAEHEEALKPIQEKLEKMSMWMLGQMNEQGVDSYKTKLGTAYKSIKASVTMADSNMFKQFVFAPLYRHLQDSYGVSIDVEALQVPLWNLVDFRALKKGVEEYIEDTKAIPPGLNVSQITTVNVRSK